MFRYFIFLELFLSSILQICVTNLLSNLDNHLLIHVDLFLHDEEGVSYN